MKISTWTLVLIGLALALMLLFLFTSCAYVMPVELHHLNLEINGKQM